MRQATFLTARMLHDTNAVDLPRSVILFIRDRERVSGCISDRIFATCSERARVQASEREIPCALSQVRKRIQKTKNNCRAPLGSLRNTAFSQLVRYGVATIGRLLKIIGLFCKKAL